MNRAPLELGVTRVSADAWSGGNDAGEKGGLDSLDDIAVAGSGNGDDDDFFTVSFFFWEFSSCANFLLPCMLCVCVESMHT